MSTLKDTFFGLYEKGGLGNHLQLTYLFSIPNIKGFSYLSDFECHRTPAQQPLPVWKSKVSLWLLLIPYLKSLYSNKWSLRCYAIKNVYTLKRKEFAPRGANSFLLELTPFGTALSSRKAHLGKHTRSHKKWWSIHSLKLYSLLIILIYNDNLVSEIPWPDVWIILIFKKKIVFYPVTWQDTDSSIETV